MTKIDHIENMKGMPFAGRVKYMANLSPDAWDKICRGCGVCCLSKFTFPDNEIAYASTACKNLDLKTRRCRCYETRLCNACLKVDIDLVADARVLPASCAYVEMLYGPAAVRPNINWDEIIPENPAKPLLSLSRIIPGSTNWTVKKR